MTKLNLKDVNTYKTHICLKSGIKRLDVANIFTINS